MKKKKKGITTIKNRLKKLFLGMHPLYPPSKSKCNYEGHEVGILGKMVEMPGIEPGSEETLLQRFSEG